MELRDECKQENSQLGIFNKHNQIESALLGGFYLF